MVRRLLIALTVLLGVVLILGSTPRPAHWKHMLYSMWRATYGDPDSLGAGDLANLKVARLDLENTFEENNTFTDTTTFSGELYADSLAYFADSTTFSEVLTFEDSAGYWDDLRVPLTTGRIGVGNPPNFTTFRDGLLQYSFAVGEQLYFNAKCLTVGIKIRSVFIFTGLQILLVVAVGLKMCNGSLSIVFKRLGVYFQPQIP